MGNEQRMSPKSPRTGRKIARGGAGLFSGFRALEFVDTPRAHFYTPLALNTKGFLP